MKRFALAALGALVALTFTLGVVSDSRAATDHFVPQLTRAKWPNGVETADSSAFTIEGAVASWATADTTASFYIGGMNHPQTNAATTQATPVLRVCVFGIPSGPLVDTLLVYVDYAQSKNGPWFSQSNAANNGFSAPTALLLGYGAGNADSTGVGLFRAAGTAPTATFNGYTGFISAAANTAASTSPDHWQFARLRFSGDKSTASHLFNSTVFVSVPADLSPLYLGGERK